MIALLVKLEENRLETKRQVLGQILICMGCCCGRTDKGKPAVPVDQLKKNWKEAGLKKVLQLTISGCLGPCDLTNVVSILTPHRQIWLGGLTQDLQYDALFVWAKESAKAGKLVELPDSLQMLEFQRFLD